MNMNELEIEIRKAFTLLEPGPVVLVTTYDGKKSNVMTISWTMVLDFTPTFAMTTGEWNYSFAALRKTKECVIAIPTVDMLDEIEAGKMCGRFALIKTLRSCRSTSTLLRRRYQKTWRYSACECAGAQ